MLDIKGYDAESPYAIDEDISTIAAEDQVEYKTIPQMEKAIGQIKKQMEKAARIWILWKQQDCGMKCFGCRRS